MIACSVCGQANEDFQTVCAHCGSYLQGRVDVLNLFETLWGLIESPRRTFKKIVLSRHKNFVLLLSMLFGIGLVFDIAWMKNLGDDVGSLLTLAGVAVVTGPPLGILTVMVLSVALQQTTRVFGGRATFRNMFAASAYAMFPLVVSLFIVDPLALASFGIYFFGTNPSPMLLKPTVYVLILSLKAIAALYAVYLLVEGTLSANSFSGTKAVPVIVSVALLIGICITTVQMVNLR